MAIVRTLGKSGYFITFTVNPNWEEIQAESNTSIQYTALDAGNAQTLQADLQDVRYLIVAFKTYLIT